MRRKILWPRLLVLGLVIWLLALRGIYAQKIGINVAAKHDELEAAARTVGPGGWITIMARPGDADTLHQFLANHPEVNIVIRTHWPDTVPDEHWALSWTATLGQIDPNPDRKIFIMPWNEPNLAREAGGNSNIDQVASEVREYVNNLKSDLAAAGLLHTKVGILSPVLDQSAPNFQQLVNALGGASFFRQFDGIAMNLYDFETDCGRPLCNGNPVLNAADYRQVLAAMGVPNAKVFALETGIVAPSSTCQPGASQCPTFQPTAMATLLQKLAPIWENDPNFIMGSPLSYDPELASHPDWLFGSLVETFIRQLQNHRGQPWHSGWTVDLQNQFFRWLQAQIQAGLLRLCQGQHYGYAFSQQLEALCQASGLSSGRPAQLVRAGTAQGQSFIIRKKVCWGNYDEAIKTIIAALQQRATVSRNQEMAQNFKGTNRDLLPPDWIDKDQAHPAAGEISFQVCENGKRRWFHVDDTIKLTVPASYQRAASNGQQIAGLLTPPQNWLHSLLANNEVRQPAPLAAAPSPAPVLGGRSDCPQISFQPYVQNGQLCWTIQGQSLNEGEGAYGCDWGYQVLLNGQPVGGLSLLGGYNNCLAKPGGTTIHCYDGGGAPVPYPGGDAQVSLLITRVENAGSHDCRPDLARQASCHQEGDRVVCRDNQGHEITPPPPPICHPQGFSGEPIPFETIAAAGSGHFQLKPAAFVGSRENFLAEIQRNYQNFLRQLQELIDKGEKNLPSFVPQICRDVDFVFTPVTSVSYTLPDETIQRLGIFAHLMLPEEMNQLRFRHGRSNLQLQTWFDNEEKISSTNHASYGEGGVYRGYHSLLNELTIPE